MKLYRYRTIQSALNELDNGTFYFAGREELNDPIEGYIHIYWQGDCASFEGLLKNYICSLFYNIQEYLLKINSYHSNSPLEKMLQEIENHAVLMNMRKFEKTLMGEIFNALNKIFLAHENIYSVAKFYGDRNIKCSAREMEFILRTVTDAAFQICIKRCKELSLIAKNFNERYFDIEYNFPLDEFKNLDDEERLKKIHELENGICDIMESGLFNLKSTPKQMSARNDAYELKRNFLWMRLCYPKMYVEKLQSMLYPDGYVICFSETPTNSAMWGNYADNHKGVCFIYETINDTIKIDGSDFEVKPIIYSNNVIERNFFETLKILACTDAKAWLTGKNNLTSKILDAPIVDENSYQNDYRGKFFIKMPEWKYENEYRALLADKFQNYDEPDSRHLKYDLNCLKGVVFGIRTTITDKLKLIQKLRRLNKPLDDFEFWQAEYDDKSKNISVRRKSLFVG